MVMSFVGNLRLATMLGWQDVRQAYRRTVVGPFWITAGMAIQIAAIGIVFGIIFKADMEEYLPFLASSIILWSFMSALANDACMAFISSEAIIRQLPLPFFVYIFRTMWKNVVIAGHNIVIIPVVFLILGKGFTFELLLFIPGMLILLLNAVWISLILATASTRYRDLPPIVSSLTGIAFYLTPVIWVPESLGNAEAQHFLLGLNPLYHLLQLVRLPILGEQPTYENWIVSVSLVLVGFTAALLAFRKYSKMIAYWV